MSGVANDISGGLSTAYDNVTTWASMPFSQDMNAWGWGLFVGLLVCAAVAWHFVLREIIE